MAFKFSQAKTDGSQLYADLVGGGLAGWSAYEDLHKPSGDRMLRHAVRPEHTPPPEQAAPSRVDAEVAAAIGAPALDIDMAAWLASIEDIRVHESV